MYCIKCGAELPDNAVFCNSCGTKTVVPEIAKINSEVTPEESLLSQKPISKVEGKVLTDSISIKNDIRKEEKKAKLKNRKAHKGLKTTFFALFGLFIVLLAGVISLLLFTDVFNNKESIVLANYYIDELPDILDDNIFTEELSSTYRYPEIQPSFIWELYDTIVIEDDYNYKYSWDYEKNVNTEKSYSIVSAQYSNLDKKNKVQTGHYVLSNLTWTELDPSYEPGEEISFFISGWIEDQTTNEPFDFLRVDLINDYSEDGTMPVGSGRISIPIYWEPESKYDLKEWGFYTDEFDIPLTVNYTISVPDRYDNLNSTFIIGIFSLCEHDTIYYLFRPVLID